jgi:hypothetical protein
MITARVIDTHRLSIVAQEYERELLQLFRDLSGAGQGIERIRREATKVHFEEIRTGSPDRLLARVGSGKFGILMAAQADAAGIAAMVFAGKLIDELGMYDEFTLWAAASLRQDQGLAWLKGLREDGVRPDCLVIAEPTNLCIKMREAAMEGFLSESHPLVEAAIATYESLFELPPILSQSPSPNGPMGIPVIAFGPGDGHEQVPARHLLKAAEFYAAFPTMFVEQMKRR